MADPTPPTDREHRVRTVLTGMADRLTTKRPADTLTPHCPKTLAAIVTADHHGIDTTADEIEAAVLQALPVITHRITRGAYALCLQVTAQGVHRG